MITGLWKAEGAGNDFIVGTGIWARRLQEDDSLLRSLCDRRRGIGADGVISLSSSDSRSLRILYRNADASTASFCANGTRVAALAGHRLLGLETPIIVQTSWASIPAAPCGLGIALSLPNPAQPPEQLQLHSPDAPITGSLLVLGVPHFLIRVSDEELDAARVGILGPQLRQHPAFGSSGANISFFSENSANCLRIRSFERGVDGEVLSCGSAIASAGFIHMGASSELRVFPRSGDELRVRTSPSPDRFILEGPARLVARIEDFDPS